MPTHKDIEAARAHMKEVDVAQENILEAMFDDLRKENEVPLGSKEQHGFKNMRNN